MLLGIVIAMRMDLAAACSLAGRRLAGWQALNSCGTSRSVVPPGEPVLSRPYAAELDLCRSLRRSVGVRRPRISALVNRMVRVRSAEWARWVVFLALGGFFGNLVLSLTDHASNGFFAKTEWIPVISSAFASGFLIVPLLLPVSRRFLDLVWW